MTVFVTGATGFLGGHFVKIASRRNWRLRCLTRTPPRYLSPNVEWVKGDLLGRGRWEKKLRGCKAVVHLATLPLSECECDPLSASELIVGGFHRLLERARRYGVTRLVMGSTAEVYGSPSRLPVQESAPLHPLSLYGFLKACADLHALEQTGRWRLSVCILRFFNLYGLSVDRTIPKTVICQFAEEILCDRPIVLHASLKNSRDFLHVKDAAKALVLAVQNKRVNGVINVGSGCETSLQGMAQRLAHLAGRRLKIDFQPGKGRLRRMVADVQRARHVLDFVPKVPLDQGLCEVLDGILRVSSVTRKTN